MAHNNPQGEADSFNEKYQVGQNVCVRKDDGTAQLTTTRSQAYVMGGSAVIMLEGVSGCYLLERVSPVQAKTNLLEYYIRNKNAGYLGNSPVWYGKNGRGYTAYIDGAHRFTHQQAAELVEEDPEKYAMYPCGFIDENLHKVFDSQDLHKQKAWEYFHGVKA